MSIRGSGPISTSPIAPRDERHSIAWRWLRRFGGLFSRLRKRRDTTPPSHIYPLF
ncbi:MAG: hypothetical protein IPM29_31905 [Planctomycetes bacterium]|nr:hypothetical protein [Planctomycetota bacterium]